MDYDLTQSLRNWYITRVMLPWAIFAIAVLIGTWFFTSSWLSVVWMFIVLVLVDYLASHYIAPHLAMRQADKLPQQFKPYVDDSV